MSANDYNLEGCHPDDTVLYQAVIPRFFIMSPPSWNFVSPTQALMQRKITLIDLQRKVWNINQISKIAFDDRMRTAFQKIGVGGAVAVSTMLYGMNKKWIGNGLKTASTGASVIMAGGCAMFVYQAYAAQKAAIEAVRKHIRTKINPKYMSAAGIEWCLIEDHGPLRDEDWHHIVIKCYPTIPTSLSDISPSSGPNSCDLHWAKINGEPGAEKNSGLAKIQE